MICRSVNLANVGAKSHPAANLPTFSVPWGMLIVPSRPNLADGISDVAGAFCSHPLPPSCFQRDTGLCKKLLDAPFALIRLIWGWQGARRSSAVRNCGLLLRVGDPAIQRLSFRHRRRRKTRGDQYEHEKG